MQIVKLSKGKTKAISSAVKVLRAGGIVIYPTETCYGIAVDPTNQAAVNKLISYKTFRADKPISIAVSDKKMAQEYVMLNDTAKNLYKEYLPGPFTIISKSKGRVAIGVESQTKTLGVRLPAFEFVIALVKKFGKPITATSANVSYKKTPYSVKDILENTSAKQRKLIDLIVDAGELPKNDPSTVIDTTLDDVNILRQGDIVIAHKHKVITKSESETRKFGEKLALNLAAKKLNKPIIVAMQGELGTGKTQMSKGVARALGVKQEVLSPTFILCREYKLNKGFDKIFHLDVYRFLEPEELYGIGFEQMLSGKNLILIEWAEKVSKAIKALDKKAFVVWINLYHKDENERIIEYGEYS